MKPLNTYMFFKLVMMLLLTASGCSSTDLLTRGEPYNNDSSAGGRIITFAYQTYGSKAEMEKLIEQYNSENKDRIQVQLLDIPKDDYTRVLNMELIAGSAPDLFSFQEEWKTTYVFKNWLTDLTSTINEAAGLPSLTNWDKHYGSYNEQLYSIPNGVTSLRLIFNKYLFQSSGLDPDNPPKTLDELARYAQVISEGNLGYQKYGFAWPLDENWLGYNHGMEIPLTYSGITTFDYKKGEYNITSVKPWLDTMLQMKASGAMLPGELSLKYDTALTQFAKGNVGMMFATSSDVYKLENELGMSLDWGVAMPPAVDGDSKGKGALMLVPEPMIGVNNSSEVKEEAIKFWTFLHQSKTIRHLYNRGAYYPAYEQLRNPVPSTTSKQFASFKPSKLESYYPAQPILLNSRNRMPSISNEVTWNSRNQAYQEIVMGKLPVKETLENETGRMNLILRTAVRYNQIRLEDYKKPQFDPLHPLISDFKDAQ
ncbi:ABC transporter substrate-binding protein [Paenibacillus sp. GCM10023252]|uniref:ABC transporter substrate-binding protein n=1 Tax=Paenibacillus sp. GCM10023252 TaxID=3252649 RepID=UPI003611ACE0